MCNTLLFSLYREFGTFCLPGGGKSAYHVMEITLIRHILFNVFLVYIIFQAGKISLPNQILFNKFFAYWVLNICLRNNTFTNIWRGHIFSLYTFFLVWSRRKYWRVGLSETQYTFIFILSRFGDFRLPSWGKCAYQVMQIA